MIAGITGGLGCGKSTVARLLEQRGFKRLDSDAIVRELMKDALIINALKARFGAALIGSDGLPDRRSLAERIFASDTQREWLEALLHPRVFTAWRTAIAAEPVANWVIEVPLLFEKDLENWFDFTVCVACAPEQQLVRLEQRGLSRELARQRISKQLPLERKIERSDFVLWNEGTPEFLQDEVDRLANALSAA